MDKIPFPPIMIEAPPFGSRLTNNELRARNSELESFLENLRARLEADPSDNYQTRLDKDLLEQLETLLGK